MKRSPLKRMLRKGLESTLDFVGDLIPVSLGMRNPKILFDRMEQFLEQGSKKVEKYVQRKLHRLHQKDKIREQVKELSILPPHSTYSSKSLDKGLSREDVLKRLAEIDRLIMKRELEIEHKQ